MIFGIGTDIVDIRRIEKALTRFGERFEKKLFTQAEREVANARGKNNPRLKAATLAKRFAAKEAFVKALGTGFMGGLSWQEMEVSHDAGGRPVMTVTGNALLRLKDLRQKHVSRIDLSMADDYPMAQAFVVISAL